MSAALAFTLNGPRHPFLDHSAQDASQFIRETSRNTHATHTYITQLLVYVLYRVRQKYVLLNGILELIAVRPLNDDKLHFSSRYQYSYKTFRTRVLRWACTEWLKHSFNNILHRNYVLHSCKVVFWCSRHQVQDHGSIMSSKSHT